MRRNINSRILYRYLAGECTTDETFQVEEWIRSSEKNRETMQALERIWNVVPRKEMESDTAMAWKHLEERLNQRESARPVRRVPGGPARLHHLNQRKSHRAWIWGRVAALIALSLCASLYMSRIVPFDSQEETLTLSEVTTGKGQRALLVLEDGSRVRLNADSRIEYLPEFGEESRFVYLTGEAYFEVMRDSRPFFVYADEAVIEILGTEFNVQAYQEEAIQVVVAEGKVAVRHQEAPAEQTAFLERGDLARVKRDAAKPVEVRNNVSLKRHLGWLEYRLEFDADPLKRVVRSLERWYEMDIRLEDPSLEDLRFTAVFEDESIDEILDALELSLGIEYQIRGREITLRPGEKNQKNSES